MKKRTEIETELEIILQAAGDKIVRASRKKLSQQKVRGIANRTMRLALAEIMMVLEERGALGKLGRVGGIRLDVRQRAVRVRGETVHLPGTPYEVMSLLLSEPGRTFTHREISKAAKSPDSELPDNEFARFHIYKLRTLLEKNPSEPKIIETIRGVGYRIGARAAVRLPK